MWFDYGGTSMGFDYGGLTMGGMVMEMLSEAL